MNLGELIKMINESLYGKKTLICGVDCTADNKENYFEVGNTEIVDASCGKYREASPKALSRFGYRFQLKNAQKPHLMKIWWPDDKRRFMCVNDGTCYDLTTGVYTGCRYEPSGEMKVVYNVFWPKWTDESVVFASWGDGEPAAVSRFEVYELEDLHASDVAVTADGFRSFGIQYEDPCGAGCSEGAYNTRQWIDRHIEYMEFTAQNRLVYPINWYHGPIFPSRVQPYGKAYTYVAYDRKFYVKSTNTPDDWVNTLLDRFDEEGLEFVGSMTLMRLGNLMKIMNMDENAIKAGVDTVNNINYDNTVQTSTNDWTVEYNVKSYRSNFENSQKGKKAEPAYGEKTGGFCAPIFNPLHPEVQRQVLEYLDDTAALYAGHPSLKGIAINIWHGTMLWFGSLRTGYDDYTVNLFEKETGIHVPVDPKDPERFAKRYKFLTTRARKAFVDWRCEKIREFICRCRDVLESRRSDLKLFLTVWNETSQTQLLDGLGKETQIGARESNYEFYRLGGFDAELFKNERNIEVSVEMNHARDRSRNLDGIKLSPEKSHMFNDFAFLDGETHEALESVKDSGGFIFNCWVEAWGNHKSYECAEEDKKSVAEMLANSTDFVPDFYYRANSSYDDDKNFWFKSQVRITAAFPAEPYYMECFANELAAHDALSLTAGGLYLDKAHSAEIKTFAENYRKLPSVKFNTLGNTDPVTVRYASSNGKMYIYAVNREPYAIGVSVHCGGETHSFTLEPFMLSAIVSENPVAPSSFEIVVPDEQKNNCVEKAFRLISVLKAVKAAGHEIPGASEMIDNLNEAVRNGRYAYIRHASASYIADEANRIIG